VFTDIPTIDVGRTGMNIPQALPFVWRKHLMVVKRERLVRRCLHHLSCKGLVRHDCLIEIYIGTRQSSFVWITVTKFVSLAEINGRFG
jgi:hypothetical protein